MQKQIYFDQSGYDNFLKKFVRPKAALQKVVDAFNSLKIGSLNTAEFQLLFTDAFESVFFDKITAGQDLVLNGIKLDKKKALEIIQKPDGYSVLLETINAAKISLGRGDVTSHVQFSQVNTIANYVISDAGKVEIAPAFLEANKENGFTYYTTNEMQEAYYKALTDFISALQSLVDKGLYFHKAEVFEHIDEFVYFIPANKKFQIRFDKLSYFFSLQGFFNKDGKATRRSPGILHQVKQPFKQ